MKLNLDTFKIIRISDASFFTDRGLKIQLGFLILLAEDTGHANIVHFASNRCKRVTRSVMEAEDHGLTLAFVGIVESGSYRLFLGFRVDQSGTNS